jgi:hypothetical protein
VSLAVTGMPIWPQIADQLQRSLVIAGAHTTSASKAVDVLTAVSAWPGWSLAANCGDRDLSDP